MRKIYSIACLLILMVGVHAQSFKVGDVNCNFKTINYMFNLVGQIASGTTQLDLNGDNVMDCSLTMSYNHFSSSYWYDSYSIGQINPNLQFSYMGFTGCINSSGIKNLPIGTRLDTITKWANGGSIYYTRPNMAYCNSAGTPFYVGYRIISTTDTLYGWIKTLNSFFAIESICFASKSDTITYPSSTLAVSSATVCKGDSVLLTGSPSGGYFFGQGIKGNYFRASNLLPGNYVVSYGLSPLSSACTGKSSQTITVKAPLLTITSSTRICEGTTLALTGTPSGGIFSGVGVTSNNLTPPGAGTTSIKYSYTDLDGCHDSIRKSILVDAIPQLSIPQTTICKGSNLTSIGSPPGGYFQYPGVGISIGTINTGLLSTGVNTFTYHVNSTTCVPKYATATVSVIQNTPAIVINSSHPYACQGQSVTLTASGATSYTWSYFCPSPTCPPFSNSNIITLMPSQTTWFTVTAFDSTLVCGIESNTITSIQIDQSTPLINSQYPFVCPSTPVKLNATGAVSYTWSNGSNSSSITVTPTVSTNYTCAVTTTANCIYTKTITQTVSLAKINSLTTSKDTICLGSAVNLIANTTGVSNYSWSNAQNCSNNICSVKPTATTIYTLYTYGNGSCSDTAFIKVNVNTSNQILNAVSNQSIICPGDTAILSLSGSSLYIVDANPAEYYVVNQQTVAIVPQVTTTYIIYGDSLINGCVSTGVFTQTVASCVAVEELNLVGNDFKIYPNPAASKLFVEIENELSSEVLLNLISIDGRKIKSLQLTNKKQEIDLSEISSGIYFVEIGSEKALIRKKLIISR